MTRFRPPRQHFDVQPGGGKHVARPPVAGRLHSHRIAHIRQGNGAQLDAVVGAIGNDDLLGIAMNIPPAGQKITNRPFQRAVAAGGVGEQQRILRHRHAGVELPPFAHGELGDIRNAGHESPALNHAGPRALQHPLGALR